MASTEDSGYDFAPGQEPPKKSAPPRADAEREAAGTTSRRADSPANPMPKATPDGPAGKTRECPFCGHTFFGQVKARCPECSAPMDAGAADQLSYSNPVWVRRA